MVGPAPPTYRGDRGADAIIMKVFVCCVTTGQYSDTNFQITRVYRDKQRALDHIAEINRCKEEVDAIYEQHNSKSYANKEDRDAGQKEAERNAAVVLEKYKPLLVEHQNQIDEGLFGFVVERDLE